MMLFEWVGGWASHGLAFYLGAIVGLIVGCFLSWYGEMSKSYDEMSEQHYRRTTQQGSTTREGDHHGGPTS